MQNLVTGRPAVHISFKIWSQASPMLTFYLIFSPRLVPGQPKSELEDRSTKRNMRNGPFVFIYSIKYCIIQISGDELENIKHSWIVEQNEYQTVI